MSSLAYNQMTSPKFKAMGRYAWWQSGYLDTNLGPFQNTKKSVSHSMKVSVV